MTIFDNDFELGDLVEVSYTHHSNGIGGSNSIANWYAIVVDYDHDRIEVTTEAEVEKLNAGEDYSGEWVDAGDLSLIEAQAVYVKSSPE